MDCNADFGDRYAAEQLRRAQHPLRRFIRGPYLSNLLKDVRGPAIDFGCGAGQVLRRLPAGSVGLEINRYLVDAACRQGMNVLWYNGDVDHFSMSMLPSGRFRSLVIVHVLEHFADADSVIRRLWGAAARLGLERIVTVVPGAKGYRSDSTHKTFVTLDYLEKHDLGSIAGFSLVKASYFPIDARWPGKFFTHHELKCVYDRVA